MEAAFEESPRSNLLKPMPPLCRRRRVTRHAASFAYWREAEVEDEVRASEPDPIQ